MSLKPSWTDPSGKETLKLVVSRCIPQWTNGLHEYQVGPISMVLNKEHVLLFTGTGSGKAALFFVPLIVHQELNQYPDNYPPLPAQSNAIAIVVTPTKGLANSIIYDIERFGLRGLSYCHETITEYRTKKKQDLIQLICDCRSWDLICVDPKHLASPEWRRIIQNEKFVQHLVLFAIDEAHLIRRWSPNFRPAFGDIGAVARGFLPKNIPIIALTATCSPGRDTAELCQSLGLVSNDYHLIWHSNERENMHIILDVTKHTSGIPKYSQLLKYLHSGRKVLIHVQTIPTAYDIYEFLFNHLPDGVSPLQRMRMYHALCTDAYNRETFRLMDSDPMLQVIIATIGFLAGINCMQLLDSIFWKFPSSIDDFVQGGGRGGRDPNVMCRSIAIISPNELKAAQEFIQPSTAITCVPKAKKKPTSTSTDLPMEEGKALFIIEPHCHTACVNRNYQNPPLETSVLDCKEAGRKVYCKLCATRYNISYTFDTPLSQHSPPSWLPLLVKSSKSKQKWQSATYLGKKERESMRIWLIDFQKLVWSQFHLMDSSFYNDPVQRFFSAAIINEILDKFLIIDSLDSLISLLYRHSWKFIEQKSDSLFRLLTDFQSFIRTEREELKTKRSVKTTSKQRMPREQGRSRAVISELEEAESEEIESDDNEAGDDPTPAVPPKPNVQPSRPRPCPTRKSQPNTVADWSATYGPQRRKRNW
ncbi:hypothetical protein D9758_015140 [Tetrapyrgos nigripes]|uniref:DNA 3'-5' helicase n=1 Tax=Tetrapyrgos nigripes TaxID=182062 RepID=A0A8H5FQ99_9AGAR|nr:hypothetical protein D9758_015140 [Tetrapyrgos nigripes]